ncbi:hypothetical protein [Telmatospirillum siberiense]|uniref:hypothetical protein n=1 Tax=Telmatospirillum siberiense TaxID=382514 RepID=UPI0013045FDD|nr:hypothetical protein [Telmatospirillum siberiense]
MEVIPVGEIDGGRRKEACEIDQIAIGGGDRQHIDLRHAADAVPQHVVAGTSGQHLAQPGVVLDTKTGQAIGHRLQHQIGRPDSLFGVFRHQMRQVQHIDPPFLNGLLALDIDDGTGHPKQQGNEYTTDDQYPPAGRGNATRAEWP